MLEQRELDGDKMKVYIAGPMAGQMDHQGYRKKIKKILRKYEVDYICPLDLDMTDLGKEESERISEVGNGTVKHTPSDITIVKDMIDRDLAAIDQCNLMIVYTPYPSYGTDMETFYHSRVNNRPTIVFSKTPKSWMLGLGDYFVSTYVELEQVIRKLLNIVNGD